MDEKKVQKFKQRLLEEYQKLIRSINRNRLAEEEIQLENTEDEGARSHLHPATNAAPRRSIRTFDRHVRWTAGDPVVSHF